ncbi:MAG TPA: hypothetical protein GYA08_16015 [Chloroflexi bacterium]|nr:hypothetical protein [Chloroflexota bacterium]
MTVTSVAAPVVPTTPPLRRGWQRSGVIILIFVAVLGGAYALAWWDAYQLAQQYMADADASFANGDYLNALAGYETFDAQANRFVTHGGYTQVENIWRHVWAWPKPALVAVARARIDEIIDHRLTIADAEQFVQKNTGRPNAYMGRIFLRLGELYAQAGDLISARDVFNEIPDLFPNDPGLIQAAATRLQNLDAP